MNRLRPPRPNVEGVTLAAIVMAMVFMAGSAFAQSETWREVDNPYQEDLEIVVGTTLSPRVQIDGVRWRSLLVAARNGATVTAGDNVDLEVAVAFENREPSSAKLLVILLLEDDAGSPLERLELKTFKAGGERLKERSESVSLPGDVVLAIRRVYVYCEVSR
jgi:hypothetical protein